MNLKTSFIKKISWHKISFKDKRVLIFIGIGGVMLFVGSFMILLNRQQKVLAEKTQQTEFSLTNLESAEKAGENNSSAGENNQSSFIWIDIGGAVLDPGLKKLEFSNQEKPRLHLAVEAAGGWDNQADFTYINQTLNLAREIKDGEKIYIPYEYETVSLEENKTVAVSTTQETSEQISKTISLNKASESELKELSGIGEVRATNIIQNRPFNSLEEAVNLKVITQKIIDDNSDILVL